MRDIAAQKRCVQHPGQLDVVDEQRLAGEKPRVLVALDRSAESARRHDDHPRIRLAAEHHRVDDVLVAGAAAQISRQRLAHLRLVRVERFSSRNAVMVIRMPGVQ